MRLCLGLALSALIAACAPTTEVVNSWKDPEAAAISFKKVIAACICGDARYAADGGGGAVQAHRGLYAVVHAHLRRGAQGSRGRQGEGSTGRYSMARWSCSSSAWTSSRRMCLVVVRGSSGLREHVGWLGIRVEQRVRPRVRPDDQYVSFNTNVYSVADAKLVWASRSETMNPSSIPQLADEVITANVQEMKHQKVMTTN